MIFIFASDPVTPEDLRSYLLVAAVFVGWAAQMIYVAFKYGMLVGKVEALRDDLNGFGQKLENHLQDHMKQAMFSERKGRQ